MFRPILFLAIIRFDTIIGENYTIYDMIQYKYQYWCKYRGEEILFIKESEGVCVCVCVWCGLCVCVRARVQKV